MAENPKTFSILSAWQEYLRLQYPEGTKMKVVEYRKLKMAFYAGYGGALGTMRDDIAFLPDKRVWEVFREIIDEMKNFHNAKSPEEFLSVEQLDQEVENE